MRIFSLRALLFRLIPAILCLVLFVGVQAQRKPLYYTEAPLGFASSKIAKSLLKEDMLFWQKVLEESHVNPYHAISKEAMDKLQGNLLSALPDSVTHFQACMAISQLIGALDEGHLGFATNQVSDSLYAYHCVRFPFLPYDFEEGQLIVQRDLSNENKLPPFSRITEINGIPVQQLYERYAKLYGGLEPWRKLQVKNNIRKLLYMDGIQSPFRIKALVDNTPVEFSTEGYTFRQADSMSKIIVAELSVPTQLFSIRFTGDNIALIEFNNMNTKLRDSFALFLRNAFREIRDRKAAGVIIDIRKNGGGDSGLGDTLISYISDKAYCSASGVKVRISSHSKLYAKMNGLPDGFKKWKNGTLYEYKTKELIKPRPNDLRYTGKVSVLIGAGTFSSANMLANALKDFKLATLIGESTAESGNDSGEIFSFMLPNTHIVATTATKIFLRANGDEKDFTGIKPDIETTNSLSDIQHKRDRVLERAIEWIKTGS